MANRRKPSNISVTRRTLIGVLASVTGIALAARIGAVNNAAVHIPEKTYGKNEWLDMDDCYLGTDDYTCEGYRFMVTNVAIMTPGEYLRLYGSDGAAIESDDNARKCVAHSFDARGKRWHLRKGNLAFPSTISFPSPLRTPSMISIRSFSLTLIPSWEESQGFASPQERKMKYTSHSADTNTPVPSNHLAPSRDRKSMQEHSV